MKKLASELTFHEYHYDGYHRDYMTWLFLLALLTDIISSRCLKSSEYHEGPYLVALCPAKFSKFRDYGGKCVKSWSEHNFFYKNIRGKENDNFLN